MKKLWILAALFAATLGYAQTTTTYTGTVKDLTGAAITSGRITWTLNAPAGGSIPGTGSFVATTVSCLINASGNPVSAVDGTSPCTITNNSSITPAGTSYTVCRQPYNVTPGSCFTTFANGGTVDISTLVPTPATQPNYGVASLFANNTWPGTNIFSGGIIGGKVNTSVNSQINVMDSTYGAKGNCSTDDSAAFTLAQTAAVLTGLPMGLFLPKPPGGCYIVSDWVWKGVPLIGQPSGLAGAGTGQGNVILRSRPGHDVLVIPDPLTTSGTVSFAAGWQLRNITLNQDNSAAPVSPKYHRWPGRWEDDAAMSASSNLLTLSSNNLTSGDVGQAITIGGAGPTAATDTLGAAISSTTTRSVTLSTGITNSWPAVFAYLKVDSEIMLVEIQGLPNGTVTFSNVQRGQAGTVAATHANSAAVTVMGNLTTTVASVSPGWASPTTRSYSTYTLSANATTAVTNAHMYLSVLGLPVTENIGNCGLAFDMQDGNSADWIATTSGGNYGKMENVLFMNTNGTNNDSCGIFVQGNPNFYGLTVNNFAFYGQKFSAVQAPTEINAYLQPSSGDYEHWSDGIFFFPWEPWISYNGLSQTLDNIQLTALAGPQVLTANNSAFDSPSGWHWKNTGFECPSGCSVYGAHITGTGHNFDSVALDAGGSMNSYWDANASTINIGGSNVYLNGYGNQGTAWQGGIKGGTWYNNNVSFNYQGNPFGGWPAAYNVAQGPYKGRFNLVGRFTGDAAFDGNAALNYNRDDLIIFPNDVDTGGNALSTTIVADTASPSGLYLQMVTSYGWSNFKQDYALGNTGHSLVVGTGLPSNGLTFYFQAKCLTGSTFGIQIGTFGGTVSSQTFSCNASYQNYALSVAFVSGDAGKFFNFSGTAGNWQMAYAVISPFKGSYSGLVSTCGTTTTCSNAIQPLPRVVWGTVALSAGSAVVSSMQAWTSTSSFVCNGTDQTSAAAVKIANTSTTSITITGTSTDVIAYQCTGN